MTAENMNIKFLWILVIAATCTFSFYGFFSGSKYFSDFAGYYTSSKILASTDSAVYMYNDDFFVDKMHSFGIPDTTFIMYVNPPPVSFVMVPLVWLNAFAAKIIWNILNLVFVIIAFYLLLKLYKIQINSLKAPLVAVLLTCTIPFLRNLQRGQIYVLLLLFTILFFQGYLQKNSLLSSSSFALLFLLKYFGWMFFILFVIEKRWKELGFSVLFISSGLLITSFLFGIDIYKANVEVILNAMHKKDFAFTGLPCMPALFGALFTFHPKWNLFPAADVSWLSTLLTGISISIMLIFSFIKTDKNSLERVNAVLILSVLFTPLAADHHYILLILPAVHFVFQRDLVPSERIKILTVIVVLFFLLGCYPELKMNSLKGWGKLLAFPRLYAAIVMWLLITASVSLGYNRNK
jgi:hypothetical protein